MKKIKFFLNMKKVQKVLRVSLILFLGIVLLGIVEFVMFP